MSTFALRSLSWSLALVLGLGAFASAQETPKSGESRSSADAAEFPFEGEVTCENLNVRLAPRLDAATGVVSVLRQGEKVVAVATSGDFLVVRAPRGATAWILGKHVKREADGSGTVIVNDAALRMDSRANAEKIGALKEGERVTIAKEHLGWFQISAPAGVKYYVARKHVRFLGALPGEPAEKIEIAPAAASSGSDADALAKMREAEIMIDGENRKIQEQRISEVDFAGVVTTLEEAVALAKSDPVKRQAEGELRSYRSFQNLLVPLKGNLSAIQKLLNDQKTLIDSKYAEKESKFDACGYVDTVGPLFNRPSAYKLVVSGRIIAFIRPNDNDEDMRLRINRLYGRYVGVTGSSVKDPPGYPGIRVITLENIEELVKK